MMLGETSGRRVWMADDAVNQHVLITGISGSGKSAKNQKMEVDLAMHGKTVVVLNFHGTHDRSQILPEIQEKYADVARYIDVMKDGIAIDFLAPLRYENGETESEYDTANALVTVIDSVFHLGCRQTSVLRIAAEFAVRHRGEFDEALQGIKHGLQQQDDSRAEAMLEKLWIPLNHGIFKRSGILFESGKINIFDFSKLDFLTQVTMAELFIGGIWRLSVANCQARSEQLYIFCDEFQVLNIGKYGILPQILREGRKYDISLVLSTQSLDIFNKGQCSMLHQAGTKLFFKPAASEIKTIASSIDREKRAIWEQKLLTLSRGQCIATGRFCIDGIIVEQPLVIT